MSLLIHATITVSGDEVLLEPCNTRIRDLLAEQHIDGEIGEHHGAGALCYDLKVKGGIPFPAFVEASQEFPDLKMVAEWIDVDAGARGVATIVNGQLTAHKVDALAIAARSARPVYVAVAADGRLKLALTFYRANRDEWLGYAITAGHDALLRVMRVPGSDDVELFATDGEAGWSLRWHASLARAGCEQETLAEPQKIEQALFVELEQMAQAFVTEWIWLGAGAAEEIVVERDRFARYGYVVCDANVKSTRLHAMKQESPHPEGRLEFSSLDPDETWIKDLVMRCWGDGSES